MADLNALAQMMSQNNQIVGDVGRRYVEAQKESLLRQQILQEMQMKQYEFNEHKSRRGLRNKKAAAEENQAEISLEFDKPLAEAALEKAQAQATEAGVDAKYAEKYARLKMSKLNAEIGRANAAAAASNRSNLGGWSPKSSVGKMLFDFQNSPEEVKPFLASAFETYTGLKSTEKNKKEIEEEVKENEYVLDRLSQQMGMNMDFLKSNEDSGLFGGPDEEVFKAAEEWLGLYHKTKSLYGGDREKTLRALNSAFYMDEDDDYKIKRKDPATIKKEIEEELQRRGISQ